MNCSLATIEDPIVKHETYTQGFTLYLLTILFISLAISLAKNINIVWGSQMSQHICLENKNLPFLLEHYIYYYYFFEMGNPDP